MSRTAWYDRSSIATRSYPSFFLLFSVIRGPDRLPISLSDGRPTESHTRPEVRRSSRIRKSNPGPRCHRFKQTGPHRLPVSVAVGYLIRVYPYYRGRREPSKIDIISCNSRNKKRSGSFLFRFIARLNKFNNFRCSLRRIFRRNGRRYRHRRYPFRYVFNADRINVTGRFTDIFFHDSRYRVLYDSGNLRRKIKARITLYAFPCEKTRVGRCDAPSVGPNPVLKVDSRRYTSVYNK